MQVTIELLLETMFFQSLQSGYERRELSFGSSKKYKRLKLGGGQAYDRSND
jgi:hypothetical protein